MISRENPANNKMIFCLILAVAAYICVGASFKFFAISGDFKSVIFLLAVIGMVYLVNNAFKITDKKTVVLSFAFSFLLSASFVIGRKVNFNEYPYFEYFKITDILYVIILAFTIYFLIVNLISYVLNKDIVLSGTGDNKKIWAMAFFVLLICWLPYLIICYPGNISSDSFSSINQSIGITKLYNHCPIMFTLFVKLFINFGMLFGDINFGIFCFSLAQMVVMAAILSYNVYWFANKGCSRNIIITIMLFFAINPLIAMYSITMWKDIMFGGFMLLLILTLYDIAASDGVALRSYKGIFSLIVCSFLVSFSRNNGFYIIVAVLFVLAIYYKKYAKHIIPIFLSVIIAISLIQGPVYSLLSIKQSNFAESVGIPIQQIGYVVKTDGEISESQEEYINELLSIETIKEVYAPVSPDSIKFNKNFDTNFLNNTKSEFLKTWFQILPNNFVKYVKAWLIQTVGYYHMETSNWRIISGIAATELDNKLGVKNSNADVISVLGNTVEKCFGLPGINYLFNIAFMVWLTFFLCLIMFLKSNCKYIICVVPLLALWGTMMIAAPTFCEFRYMFSFHLALPFIFVMLFAKNEIAGDR